MTCWGFGFKSYDLNQGTPKFFGGGPHKLLHNIPRAGYFDYIRHCFTICHILPNQRIFCKYIIMAKRICRLDLARRL